VNESVDRLSGARVVDFIPLFVHRFSREQLRALAQSEGAIIKEVPEVLFVCVHNAGRSQMAAALLDHHAKGRFHVRSAGSAPGDQINPAVLAAMDEVVRRIRDDIDIRVQQLLAELVPTRA
jgi:arsenate reductase (thioredoxin)